MKPVKINIKMTNKPGVWVDTIPDAEQGITLVIFTSNGEVQQVSRHNVMVRRKPGLLLFIVLAWLGLSVFTAWAIVIPIMDRWFN